MLLAGVLLILVAALLHSWYAGNATAKPGEAAGGFYAFGASCLLVVILLLVAGAILVWLGSSFVAALVSVGVYFFVLPLIFTPLLEWARFIPPRSARYTREESKLFRQ
jgi:uncharacterized RDD family membrane protein YckC